MDLGSQTDTSSRSPDARSRLRQPGRPSSSSLSDSDRPRQREVVPLLRPVIPSAQSSRGWCQWGDSTPKAEQFLPRHPRVRKSIDRGYDPRALYGRASLLPRAQPTPDQEIAVFSIAPQIILTKCCCIICACLLPLLAMSPLARKDHLARFPRLPNGRPT